MNVENEIRDILAQFEVDEFKMDTSFEHLGLDSIDVAEVGMQVEVAFDISIPDEEFGRFISPLVLKEYVSGVTGYE